MRVISTLAMGFAIGLAPVASLADDLDALMERLEGLETLRGDFRQSTLDGSETQIQSLRGEFQLARPDQLYWYTEPPYEQVIYVNNDIIWNFDKDLEQATRQPVTDQWEQSPALVLTGTREQISERYSVEQTHNSGAQSSYELTPLTGGGSLESLAISFDDKEPVSIRLVDSFNQTTLVNFEALEMNVELDESRFEFEPPDGVDVLEQSGS